MENFNTVEGQPLVFQYNSANNKQIKVFGDINLMDFVQLVLACIFPIIAGKFINMITHLPVVLFSVLLSLTLLVLGILLLKFANKSDYPSFLQSMIGYHFLQKKKITFYKSTFPFDTRKAKTTKAKL
jgi:hypothetical protein